MKSYDNASVSSYLAVGDVWVAFDGAAVVAEKLGFIARRGMLGYFLWPVNYDDDNLTVSRRGQWVSVCHLTCCLISGIVQSKIHTPAD